MTHDTRERRMKVAMVPERPVYPSPAALVTCVDAEGRPNIITLGEAYNLSIRRPVIVGISIAKARYSHGLISTSREFVLNLPTTRILEQVDRCGTCSGRQVDKFSDIGLTPLPAQQVRPPLIAECPVNLECRVISVQEVGDHDLFMGEVLVQHVDRDVLNEHGRLMVEKLDVLCFLNWEYWSLGERLGRIRFTRSGEGS